MKSIIKHLLSISVIIVISIVLVGCNNIIPKVTGDVEEMLESFNKFDSYASNESIMNVTNVTTIKVSAYGVTNSNSDTSIIRYNLDDMYYYSYLPSETSGRSDITVLTPLDGKLVEFNNSNLLLEYTVFSETATKQDFLTYINSISDGDEDITLGMVRIEEIDDWTYHIKLHKSFLDPQSDMNTIFEREGIYGLDKADIIAELKFDSEYHSYEMKVSIDGLYYIRDKDVEISIVSNSSVSCEDFVKFDPINGGVHHILLHDTKDDAIFEAPTDIYRTYVASGTGYSWIKFYLEAGMYDTNISRNYIIYDEFGNTYSDEHSLSIYNSGYYYIYIESAKKEELVISLFRVSDRIDKFFELPDSEGNISFEQEDDDQQNYLFIREDNKDRYIRLDVTGTIETNGEFHFICGDYPFGSNLDRLWLGVDKSIYYYIPENTPITIIMTGDLGSLDIDYYIIDLPTYTGSTPVIDVPELSDVTRTEDIVLTSDIKETRVNFTVTTAGTYNNTYVAKSVSDPYITCALYSSDGTLINSNWNYSAEELEAGDYYIIYKLAGGYTADIVIIVDYIKYIG